MQKVSGESVFLQDCISKLNFSVVLSVRRAKNWTLDQRVRSVRIDLHVPTPKP